MKKNNNIRKKILEKNKNYEENKKYLRKYKKI